jgi:hypothetical protein
LLTSPSAASWKAESRSYRYCWTHS